jgi:hypothetical protein
MTDDPLIDYARELCRREQDQQQEKDDFMADFEQLDLQGRMLALRYLMELIRKRYREAGA